MQRIDETHNDQEQASLMKAGTKRIPAPTESDKEGVSKNILVYTCLFSIPQAQGLQGQLMQTGQGLYGQAQSMGQGLQGQLMQTGQGLYGQAQGMAGGLQNQMMQTGQGLYGQAQGMGQAALQQGMNVGNQLRQQGQGAFQQGLGMAQGLQGIKLTKTLSLYKTRL